MTETETKKHTYEFGFASNSYFQGRDGSVTRDDGKTIRINEYDNKMAVCVKDRGLPTDKLPEDVKKMAAELDEVHGELDYPFPGSSYTDSVYERVREQWWNDAEWLTTEDPERPDWTNDIHSAGRSSGWCVIGGTASLLDNFATEPPAKPSTSELPWIVGINIDPKTGDAKRLEAFATEEEASSYIETLEGHEEGNYYIDDVTEQWEYIKMRDEFLELAFTLVENIDHMKEHIMAEMIREDYAELQEKREANIILSDN